jgi:hypothetical protein
MLPSSACRFYRSNALKMPLSGVWWNAFARDLLGYVVPYREAKSVYRRPRPRTNCPQVLESQRLQPKQGHSPTGRSDSWTNHDASNLWAGGGFFSQPASGRCCMPQRRVLYDFISRIWPASRLVVLYTPTASSPTLRFLRLSPVYFH